VTAPYPFQFVLKIHNGVESLEAAFIECQCQAMDAVRAAGGVWCPRALPSLDGKSIAFAPSKLRNGTERNHAVRLLPYRSAELLANVVASASLLRKLGRETAKASAALMAFDHPAAHRTFIWDLAQSLSVRPLLKHLSGDREAIIGSVLDEFETRVLPRAGGLRKCVIHGDVNDQNVLISAAGGEQDVLGIIDFGDMCHTWRVNEVAIAAAYACIALHYEKPSTATDGEQAAKELSEVDASVAIVGGYAAEMNRLGAPMTDEEWAVLPTLIAARIAVSLCVGAYSSSKDPTNEYLKLTLLPGLKALQRLRELSAEELTAALRRGVAASDKEGS
jgi:hydroxylysine kinase